MIDQLLMEPCCVAQTVLCD
uniref:Uncharacterized protein n=1 Tax=Arundo donax TaxID=35708 RepID=A0A0A8ZFV6_ARUDO